MRITQTLAFIKNIIKEARKQTDYDNQIIEFLKELKEIRQGEYVSIYSGPFTYSSYTGTYGSITKYNTEISVEDDKVKVSYTKIDKKKKTVKWILQNKSIIISKIFRKYTTEITGKIESKDEENKKLKEKIAALELNIEKEKSE